MTEQEFIDMGNLTKLRAIRAILRDMCVQDTGQLRKEWGDAMAATWLMEDRLTRAVCIDPTPSKPVGEPK